MSLYALFLVLCAAAIYGLGIFTGRVLGFNDEEPKDKPDMRTDLFV